MPKASAKNKSAPHEAEIRLYKQWSLAVTPISIYTVRVIDDIFKTIKRSIADKINFETGNDQRLSSYDEKIYQFYRELMDIYHNLAEVSYTDDALLEDETVKVSDVWNGIFAVIQSRVKLFEENTAQLGGFLSELNPVVMEKKDIVSKSIKTFSESFHNTEQRFKIEKRKSLISLAIKNMICENSCEDNLILNNALEQIQQNCFDRFYDFYSSTVAFAIINLNDLYKRREAHYYYELLMEEQQILSSIIHIQVDVLENMLSLHSSNNALREPIAILKLAHEQLNFKVEEINLLFKSTDDKNKSVENYEQFSKNILDKLSESNIFKTQAFRHAKNLFERNYTLFLKNLEDLSNRNAQKSVNQDYMKSSIYECSKIVFEHETLVDEMIEEFVRIINFYEQNKSLYEDNEYKEIIKGIYDTVDIKVESLQESKALLTADMTKLLSSFSAAKSTLCEEERLQRLGSLKQRLTEQLLSVINDDKRGQAIVKAVCASDLPDDLLVEYKEKTVRLCQKNLETLNNKLFGFKKDRLLFEISTFEEILNYSVSILRKSADASIIDFVENIDDNAKRLTNILVKHNIEIINPMPHEPFSGKEHDVLMAEANEDFKKGEIIKVMNCGYKQNEVVILRANVIAAR